MAGQRRLVFTDRKRLRDIGIESTRQANHFKVTFLEAGTEQEKIVTVLDLPGHPEVHVVKAWSPACSALGGW